jgi:hypothetical protein
MDVRFGDFGYGAAKPFDRLKARQGSFAPGAIGKMSAIFVRARIFSVRQK